MVSKLGAEREKDVKFAASLLEGCLVDLDLLLERAARLPASSERVKAWIVAVWRLYTPRIAITSGHC